MGILGGLEKFGIKADEKINLFEDPKKPAQQAAETGAAAEPVKKSESEFVLHKPIRCPVCDKAFKTLQLKSGRIKRLESDRDLRPRCEGIDIMKYNVNCCPSCGYTALSSSKYFETINANQKKLIQEKICRSFDPESVADAFKPEVREWDYDTAIALHQLSLYNAVVKGAQTSEKAYNCLVLAWLLRGKAASLANDPKAKDEIAQCKAQEAEYYKEAYEGLNKAVTTEDFPMAGMDQPTVDYLLAFMAFQMGDNSAATRSLSRVITSAVTSPKIKEKARDLKDEIIASIQKAQQSQ